jgi:integrase
MESAKQLPDDRHPVVTYLASLGQGSQRTMSEALNKLADLASHGECDARSLPWQCLRIEHTTALREALLATLAPATVNKHLAALRGVLRHCRRLGLMSAEDFQRSIDLPAVHGPATRKAHALSADELASLITACSDDPGPAGARDSALFALLYGIGLRRSEAVSLNLQDFDRISGVLSVKCTGNRGRRRHVTTREGRLALERWIDRRGASDGPLFTPINKGGRLELRRLSEQAIYIACHKRASEAGLPPVSPEDLRRSVRAGQIQTTLRRVPPTSTIGVAASSVSA